VRKNYPDRSVKPISLLPWTLNLKIFGLSALRAVLGCDLLLVTDAILFDKQLFNPLFNYLSTLSLLIPLAKRNGIPVVLYNVNLGPVTTPLGKQCLKRILDNADLTLVRDEDSKRLHELITGRTGEAVVAADCALNAPTAEPARVEAIAAKEGIFQRKGHGSVGFNVNAYIDYFVREARGAFPKDHFVSVIADVMDRVIAQLDVDIVFVITQIMDEEVARDVLRRLRQRDRVKLITNKTYTYAEIKAILARLDILVGMRTHSLIMASSGHTPVLGIIAYPKSRAYLNSIRQYDWQVEMNELTPDRLFAKIKALWAERAAVRRNLESIMPEERRKAQESAAALRSFVENAHAREFPLSPPASRSA
jgi:polysaccharide pyruvyl transferase WcaK-like protein